MVTITVFSPRGRDGITDDTDTCRPSGFALPLIFFFALLFMAEATLAARPTQPDDVGYCARLLLASQAEQDRLSTEQAEHCVDLLIDEIALLEARTAPQRGKPLPPPPAEPAARVWHAFTSNGSSVADASRLFLFGGSAAEETVAPYLWYYSEDEGGWQLAGTGRSVPSSRWHIAWSCGRGQCVAAHGTRGTSLLEEIWVYSEPNESWSKMNCRRHFCPGARFGGTMAYDPERNYHVLFGGRNDREFSLGDTNTFADGQWTSHIWFTPPYRRAWAAAEFVWLESVKAVVMHGGLLDLAYNLCDMFSWSGSEWVEIVSLNEAPCLHGHNMIWDRVSERLVVVGGFVDLAETPNAHVWYFQFESATSGTWTRDDQSTFASCVLATDPGARMAYDPANSTVVLFGGFASSSPVVASDKLQICDLLDAPTL